MKLCLINYNFYFNKYKIMASGSGSTTIDSMLKNAFNALTKPDREQAEKVRKNKRPLKMPKGYDFSVRNVNWNDYKDDFILRTDAVWERSKLLDIFYTHYKT